MKRLVNTIFPYFDTQALDAARFFFGTTAAEVKIREGSINLTDFLEDADAFDQDMNSGQYGERTISEGNRNATMSRFAGRVIKKYGDTDEAYACFLEEAAKCDPPLSDGELKTIWCSAQKFFSRLSSQEGYIPPEVYNDDTSYMPEDFSDVGQAEVLAKHFSGELRYSPATHFIRYTEHYWKNSKYITATLKESHPMLEISPRDLDADCFALCTPAATYDLRRGLAGTLSGTLSPVCWVSIAAISQPIP